MVIARKSTLRSSAVGNSARSREAVKDVVRALSQEEYQYKDPVTEFLRKLYGEVDFEGARQEMELAAGVIEDDFFLEQFKDEFVENARYLVSEAYCRIHHVIDIAFVLFFPPMFLHNAEFDLSTFLRYLLSPTVNYQIVSACRVKKESDGWLIWFVMLVSMPRLTSKRFVTVSCFCSPSPSAVETYVLSYSEHRPDEPFRDASLPVRYRTVKRSPLQSSGHGIDD